MQWRLGGIGFTQGCKGCASIISGKPRVGHDEKCRLRVIDNASVDLAVAARVKMTREGEDECQATKLEEQVLKGKSKAGENPVATLDQDKVSSCLMQ